MHFEGPCFFHQNYHVFALFYSSNMAYLMTPFAHVFFHPGKKTSIFFFQTMGFWWQDSTPNPNNAVIVRNPSMHIYILGDANSSHRKKKMARLKVLNKIRGQTIHGPFPSFHRAAQKQHSSPNVVANPIMNMFFG